MDLCTHCIASEIWLPIPDSCFDQCPGVAEERLDAAQLVRSAHRAEPLEFEILKRDVHAERYRGVLSVSRGHGGRDDYTPMADHLSD